jgi:hypothetical protein
MGLGSGLQLKKTEIRSTKSETNSKPKCSKLIPNGHLRAGEVNTKFWSLEFWSFSIVSDFGFRASNLHPFKAYEMVSLY